LYGSVPEFLKARRLDGPTCLVLDVRLPGQSGLDFQRALTGAKVRLNGPNHLITLNPPFEATSRRPQLSAQGLV